MKMIGKAKEPKQQGREAQRARKGNKAKDHRRQSEVIREENTGAED